MITNPLRTPAPVTAEDGTVVGDLACVGCGYNLRSRPIAGRCPECGLEVAHSLWKIPHPRETAAAVRLVGLALSLWLAAWTVVVLGVLALAWYDELGPAVPLILGAFLNIAAKVTMAGAQFSLSAESALGGIVALRRRFAWLRPTAAIVAAAFALGVFFLSGAACIRSHGRFSAVAVGLFLTEGAGILAVVNVVVYRSVAIELARRLGRADLVQVQTTILMAWGAAVVVVLGYVLALWTAVVFVSFPGAMVCLLFSFAPALGAGILQASAAYRLAGAIERTANQSDLTPPPADETTPQ